jgi:hypothetical protein
MTSTTAKRIGRPPKKAARGEKRASLGLKVRIDIKRRIDEAAKNSGRTQSQEAEALIEKALTIEAVLAGMGSSDEKIIRQGLEAAARKLGYKPHVGVHGTEWYPPGHPKGSISGWSGDLTKE